MVYALVQCRRDEQAAAMQLSHAAPLLSRGGSAMADRDPRGLSTTLNRTNVRLGEVPVTSPTQYISASSYLFTTSAKEERLRWEPSSRRSNFHVHRNTCTQICAVGVITSRWAMAR